MAYLNWQLLRRAGKFTIFFSALIVALYAALSSFRGDYPAKNAVLSSEQRRDISPGRPSFADSSFFLEPSVPANTTRLLDRRQTVGTSSTTYYCDAENACYNGACCGQSGICGYGPTYCGTGCISNCDAHAPCGQYSESGTATCPLNVCCSQYGFCGTDSDFCGIGCQSNCRTPASPGFGGDVRSTVIGYYESWKADDSSSGTCGTLDPSQIPAEGLTGLNFAFAYIDPLNYNIVPMGGVDSDLFARVTNAKVLNPDMKVILSIGGWSFNDNNTSTQPIFGYIASSLSTRVAFASNLYKFMVQYGFDGVDFDWEYPGAPDRGGNVVDVGNYPKLLQIIRFKFNVETKPWSISITAPTSYWYLQWFDLQEIVKYVDYINLMSYDLHGVWDSADPIGPYIYAHTNLTEIDAALNLFWRNDIDPRQINLGLAFYGRSFHLSDPSCMTPGCGFSGPGTAGPCTNTAGILSYREIEDILSQNEGEYDFYRDSEAAVNYIIYGGVNWVSYDDAVTFQQKIDYANSKGLNGLFIWAVDMDDDSFTALKAVTGKDLTPGVSESDTLGSWNVNDCVITDCEGACPAGFTKMTGLNLDATGNGCPHGGRNSTQRSFCCPPWGAPNPATCTWRGSASDCFGQCVPGEVDMVADNYGGSGHCLHGVKTFCCPATSGNAAEVACKGVSGSCPSDLPQKIGTISGKGFFADSYCCPAAPVWNNCAWHGNAVTCANNRCPIGQIEMATSSDGPGNTLGGCVLGRQMAFCCDPPFGGTGFVPVPLEDLFPDTLPAADSPVYYEAFDHSLNERPSYPYSSSTDDPNQEPFAWTIMVGAEADVQSLRKRDGSHLETFDCPNPAPSDYGVQRLKAVCMSSSDDHNCEDILIGGARGTVMRLPENCGPDDYVRVVSFKEVPGSSLPAHLEKRAPHKAKVYEIKYDYNFRMLRRDGGEVYVRFDASDHPGYWDEIVSSSPTGSVKARSPEDWREFHMAWFEHKVAKRGFGSSDSWWLDRFNALLSGGTNYGLFKQYTWSQTLYSARKNCPPSATASLDADITGTVRARLDYGISLIGTLRNFDFSESYAYFSLQSLDIETTASVEGNAAFSYQSKPLPLLDPWDPFGGSFNIKGLWTVGPYFDVTAQIQALATVSGRVAAGVTMSVPVSYTFMFPQSLAQYPTADIDVYPYEPHIVPGLSATITSSGSITLSVIPAIGFQIQLDAFGEQLVNSKVSASFTHAFTLQVGAATDQCAGVSYEVLYNMEANIDLINPLPGWTSGLQHFGIYSRAGDVHSMTCYPWSTSANALSERLSLDPSQNLTSRNAIAARDDNPINDNTLFPDIFGSLLSCPNNINTPTGNCAVKIADYGNDPSDGGAISGPLSSKRGLGQNESEASSHRLEKRGDKKVEFCIGNAVIVFYAPTYPSSGDQIAQAQSNPFSTYGPLNPTDCNDYTFGQVAAPPASDSRNWATEHILEWQLLGDFWSDYVSGNNRLFPNPVAPDKANKFPSDDPYGICKYLAFWWQGPIVTSNGRTSTPFRILATAFPSTTQYRNELVLLDSETNNLKEGIWATAAIRSDDTMNGNINNDVNKAINVCKSIINAVKYMQLDAIETILATQATRIGTYLDDLETVLAAYDNPNFNKFQYQKLGLGDEWREWIYDQQPRAVAKYKSFLDKWIPKIESAHSAPGGDGDVPMTGTEENDAILARITALQNAYAALPAWNNPFPEAWNSAS